MISSKEKTDQSYWRLSLPFRLYLRCLYAFTGFLYTAIICSRFSLPLALQLLFCLLVAWFVLSFRWLFPNGFTRFFEQIDQAVVEGNKELDEGNFDGVPQWMQKHMHYPSPEERAALIAEEEEKKKAFEQWKRERKEKKKQQSPKTK